jgi:hypothetical protein
VRAQEHRVVAVHLPRPHVDVHVGPAAFMPRENTQQGNTRSTIDRFTQVAYIQYIFLIYLFDFVSVFS